MLREHRTSANDRTAALDRRQLLLAAGLSLPVVGSLTGRAAAQDAGGGTLIFNGGANLSGLDPHTTGATVSWYLLDNIFDRLVRLDPETSEPVPSLAEEIRYRMTGSRSRSRCGRASPSTTVGS